jgi:hypothetical protein
MDSLSSHLFEALGVVTESFAKFEAAFPILHNLGKMHVGYGIPSEAYVGLGVSIAVHIHTVSTSTISAQCRTSHHSVQRLLHSVATSSACSEL